MVVVRGSWQVGLGYIKEQGSEHPRRGPGNLDSDPVVGLSAPESVLLISEGFVHNTLWFVRDKSHPEGRGAPGAGSI